MGTDKGLVKIKGKEMIVHCIDNLKPLNQEVVIVSSNPDYKKFGLPIISDKIKNNGPAQGIITALENSNTEKNLMVSCDMPLVIESLIRLVVENSAAVDICCFNQQYLYPFPGIYSKSILPSWTTEVDKGNKKVQQLIKLFKTKRLSIDHPELFLNVNTPADVKKAEDLLR
jgi:molybdopterin-guanine dinucleotide biosynthesis protein A